MAHSGVIVALYPDKQHLGRLSRVAAALPNAQSADDMHVTICYLGEREYLEPYKVLIAAALMDVAEYAPVPMPLELRIRGAGRFDHVNDDGTQAIYAAIQCPDLHTLRDAIKASLASVGAEVDQTFPEYKPHITLGYIPTYLPTPAVRVPLVTIPTSTLYLCWGNEKIALPMRPGRRRAVALEQKEVAAIPSAALAHGPGGLFSNPALEGVAIWRRRREKAQRTFGGTKRADLPDSAFIDPERRSFPVKTAQDVRDAVSSWGRYTGPLSFAEFKRRLIRRARAIGAAAALPQAWSEGNDTATRGKSLTSPLSASQDQIAFKPFASTAQQRWAFGTGQPFAKRWADETDFDNLPRRARKRKSKSAQRRQMRLKASAESQGSGGATGSGYSARAGQVIRGRLMRGNDGKFTANGSAAPSLGPGKPPKLPKKPKKPKGGGKGAKPKAPKLTPEQRRAQREAERAAEQAANLAAVGDALMQADAPLSKAGLDALAAFAAGETLDPKMAQQLADLGVVTLGEDGTPRLSPDGRKVVNAAKRGDIRAAVDASFAAGEKVGIGAAGETLPGWEVGEDGKRQRIEEPTDEPGKEGSADLSKEGEPKDPKKAGGGGGSGGGSDDPDKPAAGGAARRLSGAGPSQGPSGGGGGSSGGGARTAGRQGPAKPGATAGDSQGRRSAERQAELDERRRRSAGDRARRTAEAVEQAGITPDTFAAFRRWAEGEKPKLDEIKSVAELAELGLLDDQLEVSDAGRRALRAIENGDMRAYSAAVQDGQRRIERDTRRARGAGRAGSGIGQPGEEKKSYKHGKHDQRSHGRRGARGRAAASTYQAARAGGATHAEARAAANNVSRAIAARQRLANVGRQLEGHTSPRQRASLQAEQRRLEGEIGRLTKGMNDDQFTAVVGADISPTVRGRSAPAKRTPKLSRAEHDRLTSSVSRGRSELKLIDDDLSDLQGRLQTAQRVATSETASPMARRQAAQSIAYLDGQIAASRRHRAEVEGNIADAQRKLDADSAMSAPSTQARTKARAFEDKIRMQDYESALVVDGNGRQILTKDGGANFVSFTNAEVAQIRAAQNVIMTHNHPRGLKYPPGNPAHNGSSFSPEDIDMATSAGVAEMRAVTPTRRYYVKAPPGGWNEEYHAREIKPRYNQYDRSTHAEFTRLINNGSMSVHEANYLHAHVVWSKVFADLGIEYGYTED